MNMKGIVGITCAVLFLLMKTPVAYAQVIAITSPENNTVVSPGETITVQVSAAPNVFKAVQLVSSDFGIFPQLKAPPYIFHVSIPERFSGSTTLTALGVTGPDQGELSSPTKLTVQPSVAIDSLTLSNHFLRFYFVGDQINGVISAYGELPDGSSLHLPLSLLTASSSDQNVAIIDLSSGIITATGPGKTVLTFSYGGKSATVSAEVLGNVRGDFDGNNQVDQNDVNILLRSINKPAVQPHDGRDLNGDGKIDALDARIEATLCTHSHCVAQ